MIDTHCHLTFPDFAGRIDAVLDEAARHGVAGCITISTTTADCLDALAIAERHANVWCTAGVHPLYSDKGPHNWENLRRVARSPRCVAWGELGLDHHYDRPPRDLQHSVLHEQLAFIESCAPEIDLPVEVHCRKAFADLIPVLKRTSLRPDRFVFHCFTGDSADMRLILDFGGWVSITGVVTYKNAPELRDAVRLLPVDRLMVETDAPFLSPEPFRGVRPNAPRYARVIAEHLAGLYGLSWDAFHDQINDNTRRFFPKLSPFPG
ncbi:MAG: TatD family hydrolase [Planctomycetota bacterium]|nr:TatD family hydrolase [Planctomycetota bacterium]